MGQKLSSMHWQGKDAADVIYCHLYFGLRCIDLLFVPVDARREEPDAAPPPRDEAAHGRWAGDRAVRCSCTEENFCPAREGAAVCEARTGKAAAVRAQIDRISPDRRRDGLPAPRRRVCQHEAKFKTSPLKSKSLSRQSARRDYSSSESVEEEPRPARVRKRRRPRSPLAPRWVPATLPSRSTST